MGFIGFHDFLNSHLNFYDFNYFRYYRNEFYDLHDFINSPMELQVFNDLHDSHINFKFF